MGRLCGVAVLVSSAMLTGCFDEDLTLHGQPLTLELTARKDYRPSRWTDGNHSFEKDTRFQIPAKLDVVSGTAGNHKSYLFFKKAKDKKESRCEYKGGSSQANPKGQKELDKGKAYLLVKCDGGLKADSVALAKDLRLRVDHGGNEKESPFTVIRATILYEGARLTPTPSPTPAATGTPRPTPTVSPTPDIFAGLPPDPGEAGRATVLGVDADSDGVRDDIQRWIHQTAPTSKPARNALKQYASTAQKLYAAIGNDVEVEKLVQESSYASGCARYILSVIEGRDDELEVMNSIRARILNTHARMKAEEEVSRVVSGKPIRGVLSMNGREFCKFNPDER
jgi:hypothetical protein